MSLQVNGFLTPAPMAVLIGRLQRGKNSAHLKFEFHEIGKISKNYKIFEMQQLLTIQQ